MVIHLFNKQKNVFQSCFNVISMADNNQVVQDRYFLLKEHDIRKGILERNRWVLFAITSCLMVLTTLWLMFVHVNKEGLLYPHEKWLKQIPNHWLQRAIIYNTYDLNELNYTDIFINDTKRGESHDLKLVCYYNFPDEGSSKQLIAKHIDAHLCTHINIAFATIRNNSIFLTKEQIFVSNEILDLKLLNKDLKILLSIGGAGDVSGFSAMVVNHENRKTFIKSVLNSVLKYKFDGIDLDWEFPGENSADGKERMHFTQLLREIRNEINRQDRHKFLLTVAVAAPVMIIDTAYDVTYMNEYVDFVNVMSYDYHFYTKFTPFTGINSPLYASEKDGGYLATLNINYTAHYWWQKGMDPKKIIIGLPAYAHTFNLVNGANNGIRAPASGYGSLGQHGFASFHDFCLFIKKNQVELLFDSASKSPYATKNNEWISFDDIHSFEFKANFIKNRFGGAMIYALNTDDHMGICYDNKQRFPLTRRLKKIFDDDQDDF